MASYVEDSSGRRLPAPAVGGGGGGGKPAKSLVEFSVAFKRHFCREVPDPALRSALRKAMSETAAPVRVAFLKKHRKLGESVRTSGTLLTIWSNCLKERLRIAKPEKLQE